MVFLLILAFFQTANLSTSKEGNTSLAYSSIIYRTICPVPSNNSQLNNLKRSENQALFNIPLEWENPSDEKQASKINKQLANRKKYLYRQAKRFEAKAKKKLANKNKIKATIFINKAKEARLGYAEMEQAQNELDQLRISPEKFTFIYNQDNISYTYMNAAGTIVIEFNSYVNAVHELTHAFQHLTGQIECLAGTYKVSYVDIIDELKAYKRQYFFSPYSFNKLKSDSYIKIKTSKNIRYFWVSKIYFIKDGKKEYPYKKLKTIPANKLE